MLSSPMLEIVSNQPECKPSSIPPRSPPAPYRTPKGGTKGLDSGNAAYFCRGEAFGPHRGILQPYKFLANRKPITLLLSISFAALNSQKGHTKSQMGPHFPANENGLHVPNGCAPYIYLFPSNVMWYSDSCTNWSQSNISYSRPQKENWILPFMD